jgi:phosphoenolpyruvate carboxykinase (diphosphate)
MDLQRSLGFFDKNQDANEHRAQLLRYIQIKLAFMGVMPDAGKGEEGILSMASDLIDNYQENRRLLSNHLCPVDQRIQDFINDYLSDCKLPDEVRLPSSTFVLDYHGLARELSLPMGCDKYESSLIQSFRVRQGVLHNPFNDRRTTKGVFHVAEGGLPIPADKKAVPKKAFAGLLARAFAPPRSLMPLPFTANNEQKAESFVSLLLRPIVVPEVPGVISEKTMEIRFFAPGNLVSNLDFVESIFGNAGDPELPTNDAGLMPENWTGTTGCVILAPHLIKVTKAELGLPHKSEATDRQKRDGMCWESEQELYNDGSAFKITARTKAGVIITVIADNYFGYCKKEVKTQIGYSANIYGLAEEEHAGGAYVCPSYHLGYDYTHKPLENEPTLEKVKATMGDAIKWKPEGYGVDRKYKKLVFVPERSRFDTASQTITWEDSFSRKSIKLLPEHTYMLPSGYRVSMDRHPGAPSWRIIGSEAEGTLCHKPCTVSGGGKSEISKSFSDSYIFGPFYVSNLEEDLAACAQILERDYSDRFQEKLPDMPPSRTILSHKRSLGSVIKLLTPSPENNKVYNTWLKSIPPHILSFVFLIKRFYQPEWKADWKSHFSVDIVNGVPGHELKLDGRKLVAIYVRMGFDEKGAWRTFKLRQDFIASDKIQVEDDITASVVFPASALSNVNPNYPMHPSVKLVKNCEYRLFQRPDDAIHRGFDKQAEKDIAEIGSFISNFQPLNQEDAINLKEDAINFEAYTQPMQNLVNKSTQEEGYFVSSAHPRIVDGAPTKNPRYLQNRPDVVDGFKKYAMEMSARLSRGLAPDSSVFFPVNAVLPGHRCNPPEPGVRALAMYNPLHYMDLPELFMDYICSVTGKSPSTTGAGSEGALTKGPFNALTATSDLNNALVSMIITNYKGFFSAAGHVGPKVKMNHDVSLFIPEIWSRLPIPQRDPDYLIRKGYLEKIKDFEQNGKNIPASVLGYRITDLFVATFMGKIFDNPRSVFSEEILKPELQDMDAFVDGIDNLVGAYQRAAENYFIDGSIEFACPPLKALLSIMAHGQYEGKTLVDPEVRQLFSRADLLASDWYKQRLNVKQERDIALWTRHVKYLKAFSEKKSHKIQIQKMEIQTRLKEAEQRLKEVSNPAYLEELVGTIGADPIC